MNTNTTTGVLKLIDISSLPEELRTELKEKLGKYEGQSLNNQLMRQIERDVIAVDQHLLFRWQRNPGSENGERTYSLQLSIKLATGYGVVGGVTGGINGGVAGIVGPAPALPTAAAEGSVPGRIRVGGNVQQTKLIEQQRPVYPPEAKAARIQGLVRFQAIIARDVTIANLNVVTGHPLLVPAALEAVKNWVYQTTLLNGEPVEVETQIDVNFTLAR